MKLDDAIRFINERSNSNPCELCGNESWDTPVDDDQDIIPGGITRAAGDSLILRLHTRVLITECKKCGNI